MNKTIKLLTFLLAATGSFLVSAIPAFAITKRDDGDEPGVLMSAGDAILIFAGIPALVVTVLVILIWAPSRGRSKSTEISNY